MTSYSITTGSCWSGRYSNKELFDAVREYPQVPISDDMLEACKTNANIAIQIALKQGVRWVEAEPYMIDNSVKSCSGNVEDHTIARYIPQYCRVIGGRWRELEDAIIEVAPIGLNISLIIHYCNSVLNGRWTAVEPYIKSPSQILEYSRNVLRNRWFEKEAELLKNKDSAYSYCLSIVREKWPEFEKLLIECDNDDWKQEKIVSYAEHFGRFPEGEVYINKPYRILAYAEKVIGERWPEKEQELAKDAGQSFLYAQNVIRGSFPEAEKNILDSVWYYDYFTFATKASRDLAMQLSSRFPKDMTVEEVLKLIDNGRNSDFEKKLLSSTHNQGKAVWYAVNILKSRWPEMEEKIKKSAKWSVVYARDVIKGRWEEGEKVISKDERYLSQYGVEVIKGRLPVPLHNKMLAFAMLNSKDKDTKKYFEMLEVNP